MILIAQERIWWRWLRSDNFFFRNKPLLWQIRTQYYYYWALFVRWIDKICMHYRYITTFEFLFFSFFFNFPSQTIFWSTPKGRMGLKLWIYMFRMICDRLAQNKKKIGGGIIPGVGLISLQVQINQKYDKSISDLYNQNQTLLCFPPKFIPFIRIQMNFTLWIVKQ